MEHPLRDGSERIRQVAAQKEHEDSHPRVQLAQPRQGPWSGNNQLGVELPFLLNTETSQSILKLDEWGFPEVWTVSLGVTFTHELKDGEFFDCTGTIEFGSGGIIQSFDVDWVDGTVFALPMNAVDIKARWNDLAAILGLGVPAGVKVSALISRGAPARSRATKSDFFILAHSGEATSTSSPLPHAKVPRFSKSLQILAIHPADNAILYGNTFQVNFFANQFSTDPVATVTGTFLGPNIKVPIPPFAHYYGMTITGTQSAAGWAMFNLFDE